MAFNLNRNGINAMGQLTPGGKEAKARGQGGADGGAETFNIQRSTPKFERMSEGGELGGSKLNVEC
jgi:hypothetical protein